MQVCLPFFLVSNDTPSLNGLLADLACITASTIFVAYFSVEISGFFGWGEIFAAFGDPPK